MLLGILAFWLMIVVAIMVHEAAHYLFAKRFGFKVEEFFVGFGPRLWSFRRGETEYGVKAILAGGYVKIAGMNPYQLVAASDPDYPRTYGQRPIWQRAVTIFAGPATHFVLAFAFFLIWLMVAGRPVTEFHSVTQQLNGAPSPAATAGLRPGDRVLSVSAPGGPVVALPDNQEFSDYLAAHAHDPLRLVVERDGEPITATMTPVASKVAGVDKPRIGVVLDPSASVPVGLPTAAAGAVDQVRAATVQSITMFGRVFGPEGIGRLGRLLFTNAPRQPTDPTSVIGVGRAAGELGSQGQIGVLLLLFGSINVFIGLLNLLPLPPFDGGHLAVLAVEKIRRRPIDLRRIVPVSAVVLVFFVTFTIAVVLTDLTKPLQFGP